MKIEKLQQQGDTQYYAQQMRLAEREQQANYLKFRANLYDAIKDDPDSAKQDEAEALAKVLGIEHVRCDKPKTAKATKKKSTRKQSKTS